MRTSKIWTIGHSNKPLIDFVALLKKYQIKTLVDCRTYPRSRWSPQFNAASLETAANDVGIGYEPNGTHLGGLDENTDYDQTIHAYAERAKNGERIAIMCSEADPAKCHRKTMLAPSFIDRNLEVHHILWTGEEIVQNEVVITQEKLV